MPSTIVGIDGVLFDYGRTLVTFAYPRECLLAVLSEFRPRIEAALGAPALEAETILQSVLLPLEDYIDRVSEDEVDYMDVFRNAWHGAGMPLPDDLLWDILDAEQRCWDQAVRLDPDARPTLTALRERGVKRGICSNAPFPPQMMRRQLRANGIAELVDAVVFSSEVGRRKPAPDVYRRALDAIGTTAERTLFVGDRVREDYEGPRSVGMHALLVTAHAAEAPPDGVPAIESLGEVLALL